MKRKGILFALLTASMIITACTAKEPEKEKVVLRIKTPPLSLPYDKDHPDTEAYDMLKIASENFKTQYDKYDVDFIIDKYQYVDEKKEVVDKIGTKDAADIIFAGSFNIPTYILKKQIIPLNDIVDDSLRKDIDEAIWSQCSYKGDIYTIPYFQLQNTLMVNKLIMEKAGLKDYIPKDGSVAQWSIEEFNEILETLQTQMDGANSYPMFMYSLNNQGDIHTMTLLRSYGSKIYDDNGYFDFSTPEGIKALAWLKELDTKGLIPKGTENMELMNMVDLFNNGQLAISPGNQVNYKYAVHEMKIPTFLANFPNVEGNGYATTYINGFNIFDNKDEDKIQAAKDFLRYLYTDEEVMKYTLAGIPVNKSVVNKYKDDIELLETYNNNSENLVDFLNNTPNWEGVRAVFYKGIQGLMKGELTPEEAAKQLDRDCNAAINEGKKE